MCHLIKADNEITRREKTNNEDKSENDEEREGEE